MAAKKSIKRVKIERAFTNAGIDMSRRREVFIDKRKTGFTRIKFAMLHLTAKQRLDVRHELRKEFTHHDFRLQDVPRAEGPASYCHRHGTAVHLYD